MAFLWVLLIFWLHIPVKILLPHIRAMPSLHLQPRCWWQFDDSDSNYRCIFVW
jgi:hypothetical protein